MSKTVEFYFDLGSPATYLAYTQLPKICEQTDSQLIYIPILLGGVFKATGNASPATIPAKGQYMFQDLDRYAKRYGMQLRHPERFLAFIDCLFKALWVDGRSLDEPATVAAVLTENSFDPNEVLALTADEEVKAILKDNTEKAVQRGVFGAPSMFVYDQLFFGQDRLDFVREALN
jgi:2-hydroxychromene-2-carboxylate isomerase